MAASAATPMSAFGSWVIAIVIWHSLHGTLPSAFSAIAQSHSNYEQANCGVRGVTEKVEGVGSKRGGIGSEARADLYSKHRRIDTERGR